MENSILEKIKYEFESDNKEIVKDKDILLRKIENLQKEELNIMFVGATGVGKSSTINSIFNTEIAKVGYSVDPETATIKKYEINNMILWDTPGLGDNPEKDKIYAVEIANALKLKNSNGDLLIDEVVVLIDGSNRDMKTTYEIIENVVMPYIGDTKRIVIAINQCDLALKGRGWNHDTNKPDKKLEQFLNEKVDSVRKRIFNSTEVVTNPIFYSALYSYNISKLLLTMMLNMPETKRFLFTDSLNNNPDIWRKSIGSCCERSCYRRDNRFCNSWNWHCCRSSCRSYIRVFRWTN